MLRTFPVCPSLFNFTRCFQLAEICLYTFSRHLLHACFWVLIYRVHPRMQDPVEKISSSDTGVYCLPLAHQGLDGRASVLVCFIRSMLSSDEQCISRPTLKGASDEFAFPSGAKFRSQISHLRKLCIRCVKIHYWQLTV